jgi:DNA-binding CsgD family transcriptional regulator
MDASTLILVVVIDPSTVVPPRRTTAARPPEHTVPAAAPLQALTRQEATVAAMAGRALTNQQIARRMGISPHTVNFHLRRVYRKLGICSRVHLARLIPAAEPGPGAAPGAHCDRGSGDDPRP